MQQEKTFWENVQQFQVTESDGIDQIAKYKL
jgi:hypothetical protein